MYINKNHFIQSVEQRIEQSLHWDQGSSSSAEPALFSAARHLCLSAGGKRARPKLVYFFSKGLQLETPLIVDIAVTSEFIHSASLLHDDVIDHGVLRRGAPTVNVVWDSLTAVLAGDILLSESIRALKDCPRVVADEALQLVSDMTKATMLEAHIRNSTEVSLDQWLFIAEGKTASMFQWCGRAVAHLSEEGAAIKCFDGFGKHFGIAFQMADDLLDLQPTDSGKTAFSDIRNRNPSYPLILAQQGSHGFSRDLKRAWSSDRMSEREIIALGEAIISTGAADQTYEKIQQEVTLSIEKLGSYAFLPGCMEIAQWARAMCHRFQKPEAV